MKHALILTTLLTSSLALASVTISGPRTVDLKPGETRTVEYTLKNMGDKPATATVFFNDYTQMPDGSLSHIPARSLPQSLFAFASFSQTTFNVPANGAVVVPMKVSVPKNAAGGYWGVIGVNTPPPAAVSGAKNTVGVHVRYAMVTTVEVGTIKSDVRITNLAATRNEAGKPAMSLTVTNNGNAYERYELKLTYQNAKGEKVEDKQNLVVMPGLSVDLTLPVPAKLGAGTYGVFATATYREDARAQAVGTITLK